MSRSAKLNMSRGAVLSMVRLASGIIRVKVVALALGVGGVGIFALAQQVSITAVSLVGLGLATPIINLGRPSVARARYSDAGEVAGSALAILALNITILILVGLIAGPGLMQSYGQSDQWLLWALVAAIILGAAASTFWEGMSFLSDRFDIYTKAGIASALADLVFIASGAWAYGLRGAVLALPMGPLVLFAAYALLLRRDPIAREVLGRLSFSLARLRPLLTYSAMMFGAGAVTSIGLTAGVRVTLTAGIRVGIGRGRRRVLVGLRYRRNLGLASRWRIGLSDRAGVWISPLAGTRCSRLPPRTSRRTARIAFAAALAAKVGAKLAK